MIGPMREGNTAVQYVCSDWGHWGLFLSFDLNNSLSSNSLFVEPKLADSYFICVGFNHNLLLSLACLLPSQYRQ